MTLRGNYHLLFASQLITGILTWFACQTLYLLGIVIGFIPFALGMLIVLYKHKPDEREIALTYQISTYEGIGAGVIAGVIYTCFPQINWFFALISGISVVRGIVGLLMFSFR
jgi:hypothetical protein